MCAGAVVTINLSHGLGAGETPGGLPEPSLPLDHPHHHPPSPVAPHHILNLVIRKPENNTDNQTLQILTVSQSLACLQSHYKGYLKAEYETTDKVENVVYLLAGVGNYESDEVAGPQEW